MLLKFVLSNYRSFKESVILDLEACSIKEYSNNVLCSKHGTQPINLLKSIVLMGANASGKSNLFKGFDLMRYMVINSARESELNKNYTIEPFLLNTETEGKPSLFECSLIVNDITYRYGFKANNREVHSEWLYMIIKRREETVFVRNKVSFEIVKRFPTDYKNKLLILTELTRKDALFLSVLCNFNIEFAIEISKWFAKNTIYTDKNLDVAIDCTTAMFKDPFYKSFLEVIIDKSDLGFTTIEKQKNKSVQSPAGINFNGQAGDKFKREIRVSHPKFNGENQKVDDVFLELNKMESSGSQNLIALLGPMVKILKEGGVFWIDDLDAKIHPYIISMIMDLFNSEEYNLNGAQIVAISYNQQILKKLRRDQIIYLNKDVYGVSSLSALYVYNPHVRSKAIFDNEYQQGSIRGVPQISEIMELKIASKMDKNVKGAIKNHLA